VDRQTLRSARLTDPQLERTIVLAHRSDVNPTRATAAMRAVIVETADYLAARSPETLHPVTSSS
jgi:hypothetical protein